MPSKKSENESHPSPAAAPVLVEVVRGTSVENRHRGSVAIVDGRGQIVAAWGDVEAPTFLRSAAKPIQALPLIESGAADHFGLSDREIALACASHNGEPIHIDAIGAWLQRIGLGIADLECGVHPPMSEIAATEYSRSNIQPTALVNACSGQHTGFLTTARYFGEETRGYVHPEHPIQRRIVDVLTAMASCDLSSLPTGIDGCGIPVIAIPLRAAATSLARLASPIDSSGARAIASRRIFDAMVAYPDLVGGNRRFDTRAIVAAGGEAVVKMGADGIQVAALKKFGLGIVVKIDDGNQRAAEVVMSAILERLFCNDRERSRIFSNLGDRAIRNWSGTITGHVRPAAEWMVHLKSLSAGPVHLAVPARSMT